MERRNIAISELRKDGLKLQLLQDFNNDKEIVIEAVTQNGMSLEYASEELKNDKEVVTAAVREKGSSICFSNDRLRNDREVVIEAVKQFGGSLRYCSDEIKNDKGIVIEAVRDLGSVLQYASDDLKDDREVVLEAVIQNGLSLEYASKRLKNEKSIVIEAVRVLGVSLNFASESMRNDREVVLEAVKQNGESLNFAHESFRNDGEILKSCKFFEIRIKSTGFFGYPSFPYGYNPDRYKDFLEGKGFNDLEIRHFVGSGASGGTYRCRVYEGGVNEMVVKLYNDPFLSKKKKEEMITKDCLYIPYHINVVSILLHSKNETIDLYKLPDYETYWKEAADGKRVLRNCGMILMLFFHTTLESYLNERKLEKISFKIEEVRRMFWGLLCGVNHLNQNKIVHRDLHSDNIFVIPHFGRILIGDFGCCLDLRKHNNGFKVHKDHDIMFSFTEGTFFKQGHNKECGFKKGGLEGIAPEIKNFDPSVEEYLDYEKSDIYSIGVLIMRILEQVESDEDDIGISDFVQKLVINEAENRIGCKESMLVGKFIKMEEGYGDY